MEPEREEADGLRVWTVPQGERYGLTEASVGDLARPPYPRESGCRTQARSDKSLTGTYRVLRAIRKGDSQELAVRDLVTSDTQKIYLSRFTYLWKDSKGRLKDTVLVRYSEAGSILEVQKSLEGHSESASTAKVFPYFRVEFAINDGKAPVSHLVIHEAVDSDDLSLVHELSPFHYLANEPTWGRKVFLLAFWRENQESEGHPVGYLMLTSPALLSTPRSRLFGWEDVADKLANANRVVRIARVVVHPEFRGLGIGAELVRASLAYARDFWNVQGMKPWLVETVAEMSRFHPVFRKAGMMPYGDTTGGDDVVFTPRSKLVNRQGQGHYRASIYRIRGKIRTPKPYYWFPIGTYTEARLKDKRLVHGTVGSASSSVDQACGKILRLENVSLSRNPETNWSEPHTLRRELIADLKRVEESHKRFERSAENATSVYVSLLKDPKLDSLISRIPDSKTRRTLRAVVSRVRKDSGNRVVRWPNLPPLEKQGAQPNALDTVSRQLVAWELRRSRTRSSLLRLTRRIERSLVHSRESERNRSLSAVRLALIHLIEDLESGPSSKRFEAIRSAFGVHESRLLPALSNVNIDILPGQVVMITGPSGSGKSTMLDIISGAVPPSSGRLLGIDPAKVGVLELDFDPTRRLIDLVGSDAPSAVSILNSVGLTEASLYLRRRDELSHGQRYRAAAALLVNGQKRIWLADEFCTFLDPTTTRIVAQSIRKVAKASGATLIVATPDPLRLTPHLAPDVTVKLRSGRVVAPSMSATVWGGSLTPKMVAIALQRLRDLTPQKVNRRLLRLVMRLKLARTIATVDQPPVVVLTRIGRAILSDSAPENAIALHFYWHDLVLHRTFNERTRRTGHGPPPRGRPPIQAMGLGFLGWKRITLRREVQARQAMLDHLVKHSLVQIPYHALQGG